MLEKIKVKIVKTADTEQLKYLFNQTGWWDEEDNEIPEIMEKIIQGSFCFALAQMDDRVIGMGRAISDGVRDAYIQDVAVLEEFRGKGIGVLIMDEIVKYLKSKNITWISLISEPKAVSFYQRFGFSQMTGYVPFTLEK